MPLLFCSIAWMREYQGHDRPGNKYDQPQRGGSWVDENGTAHECCNFLPAKNGMVYGHVETIRGERDTKIGIEELGAQKNDDYIDSVDVIWIATHKEGGRRVVGWYKNARVYRERQFHEKPPTRQHRKDSVGSYRITTQQENTHLILEVNRNLKLGRKGEKEDLPGQNALFYPSKHPNNPKLQTLLNKLHNLINKADFYPDAEKILRFDPEFSGETSIQLNDERTIKRVHGDVVNALHEVLLEKYKKTDIYNTQLIDLAINENGNLTQIYEIKTKPDRQSIYTGIGQLLFHSEANPNVSKVLVLPKAEPKTYEKLYDVFDEIGIWIAEYTLHHDKVSFFNLPE